MTGMLDALVWQIIWTRRTERGHLRTSLRGHRAITLLFPVALSSAKRAPLMFQLIRGLEQGIQGSSLEARWSCLGQSLLLTLETVKWSGWELWWLTLRLSMYSSQKVWGLCRRQGCSSQTNSVLDISVIWLIWLDQFSMLNTRTCMSRSKPERNHQENRNLEAVLHRSLFPTPGSGPLESLSKDQRHFPAQSSHTYTHGEWIIKPSFSFPRIRYWQNEVKSFVLGKTERWDDRLNNEGYEMPALESWMGLDRFTVQPHIQLM